ncbi:MAG: LysE family translocator, partial [Gemmobacter sp.]
MTVGLTELALYAGALVLLFITPGPVWVALGARALSGGFAAAWPLAVGVSLGDALWPLAAILGLNWIVAVWGDVLGLMRWVAVAMFLGMGWALWRKAGRALAAASRLTRPGAWAGPRKPITRRPSRRGRTFSRPTKAPPHTKRMLR